jgi:uncharacterized protein YyaL (SSP411 family)
MRNAALALVLLATPLPLGMVASPAAAADLAAQDQTFVTEAASSGLALAVALFRREAQAGQNEQLRKLAEEMLPTLQEHLQMARSVGRQVGVKG